MKRILRREESRWIITATLLAGLAGPLYAQVGTQMSGEAVKAREQKDGEGPWSASVAAGYTETSGNSESSAANLKAEVRYDMNRWHHMLGGTAVGTSSAADRDSESVTTAEAYWAGFKTQYDLTERYYAFGAVDWYKDRFSAYDHQLYETAGLGWRILRGDVHFLDVEAGYGLRQARLQSGDDDNEGVAVVRGIYTWQISDTAAFVQRLAVLSSSSNTYSESISELKASIVGDLSLVLGYTVKHNSDVEDDLGLTPPRPFDKTDTLTTLSLEYTFR